MSAGSDSRKGSVCIKGNNFEKIDVDSLSALALAFVGDSVFDLFIRTMAVGSGKKVGELHTEAVNYVSASAQADILDKLKTKLTPKEKHIVRNARNAKVNTVPKNTGIMEYHYSTAFEALLGYLYLSEQNDRLNEILQMAYNFKKQELRSNP